MIDQPLPTGDGEEVTSSLVKLLLEREEKGRATYGTTLKTRNGRDAIIDLRDELLDGAQYCEQLRLERDEMLSCLEDVMLHFCAAGEPTDPHLFSPGRHRILVRALRLLESHGSVEIKEAPGYGLLAKFREGRRR